MRLYYVKDKKSNTIMIRQDFKNMFKNKNGRNELLIKNCTIKTSKDSIPYTITFEDVEHKIIKNVFIWIKTKDDNEVFDSFRYSYCKLRLTHLEFISLRDRLKDYDSTKEYDITFSYAKLKDSLVIKFNATKESIEKEIEIEDKCKDEKTIEQIKEEHKVIKELDKPLIKPLIKPFIKSIVDNSFYIPKSFSMPSREERTKLSAIGSRAEYNAINMKEEIEEEFEVA